MKVMSGISKQSHHYFFGCEKSNPKNSATGLGLATKIYMKRKVYYHKICPRKQFGTVMESQNFVLSRLLHNFQLCIKVWMKVYEGIQKFCKKNAKNVLLIIRIVATSNFDTNNII